MVADGEALGAARRRARRRPPGLDSHLQSDGTMFDNQPRPAPPWQGLAHKPGAQFPAFPPRSIDMPRMRAAASPTQRRSARTSSASPLLETAQRMVGQIEALADEMAALRADNEALRRELQDAVAMMERASTALGGTGVGRRRSRAAVAAAANGEAGPRRGAGRGAGRRAKAVKGRATPPEVTADVVRAVLAKLGEATAAEVAAEITRAGVPVSGRAVRFIAERAGAQTSVGPDGQRRYRL